MDFHCRVVSFVLKVYQKITWSERLILGEKATISHWTEYKPNYNEFQSNKVSRWKNRKYQKEQLEEERSFKEKKEILLIQVLK
jgi:hypothetical protein